MVWVCEKDIGYIAQRMLTIEVPDISKRHVNIVYRIKVNTQIKFYPDIIQHNDSIVCLFEAAVSFIFLFYFIDLFSCRT